MTLLWIALAGAAGALARYGLLVLVERVSGEVPKDDRLWWGTLTVNLLGCLLFGLLVAFGAVREWGDGALRAVVFIGFLGAFTTFSTFAGDNLGMLQQGRYGPLLLNVGLHVVAGIGCAALGLELGKRVFS